MSRCEITSATAMGQRERVREGREKGGRRRVGKKGKKQEKEGGRKEEREEERKEEEREIISGERETTRQQTTHYLPGKFNCFNDIEISHQDISPRLGFQTANL